MRAVFVIQKLAELKGGAERVVTETARAMAERGIAVTIWTFEARSGGALYDLGGVGLRNLFPLFARPGAAAGRGGGGAPVVAARRGAAINRPHRLERLIRAVPDGPGLSLVKWHLTHGFFRRRLRAALAAERPDVVVAFLRPAITACGFAAEGLGIRTIASLHNVPAEDFESDARWDRNPVYRAQSLAALERVDAIHVLLPEFRDWFAPPLRRRVHVIGNPVARLTPLPSIPAGRAPVVLAVGRLTAVKRFDLLITAWARLCPSHPRWRLRIFGDGPERGRLRALIDGFAIGAQAELAGVSDALGPEYDQASILCHPAAHEGFGLSVAEALAHGLPAVGFADCAGVNTLVRDGLNGVLVAGQGDAAALAAALDALIRSPRRRRDMAAAAPRSVAAFAPDAVHDQWQALLRGDAEADAGDRPPTGPGRGQPPT